MFFVHKIHDTGQEQRLPPTIWYQNIDINLLQISLNHLTASLKAHKTQISHCCIEERGRGDSNIKMLSEQYRDPHDTD